MPIVGEITQRSDRSALTECELAMMDAISTIDMQAQLDSDTITVAVPEKPQSDKENINSATSKDISTTAPAEEMPNETEAADDTGQHEVNQPQDIDEGEDSDSDTASEVSTVTYGSDDNEDAEPVSPGLRTSQSAQHSFTSVTTPASESRQSSELSLDDEKDIFDNVRVPISLSPSDAARGSSETDLLDEVQDLVSADASRPPRPRSRSQSQSPAQAQIQTQSHPLHQTLTPPKTPVPAHEATPSPMPTSLPPSTNVAPIQFDPTTTNVPIKRETSVRSALPPPISALTSQLSALTTELRNTTALLDSQNTDLDTLSPRLNNLVTDCVQLAKTRKSILAKRKALTVEIDINRDTLEGKKNGAKRLREEQIELLHSREQTQNEINVLTQKKREIQKDLSKKKYEAALEKEFADRGCREVARRMGWQPPVSTPEDDEDGEGEQDIFDDDLLLHHDESDEDEELKEGNEADFRRVAQALITGDRSLDLAALSRFQEGLGAVDDRVKQEEGQAEGQHVRIKSERRSGSIDEVSNSRQDDNPMFFPETAAGEKSVEVGEITIEKIQAKLRSFDHIRDDLAEMFKVLAGGSKAPKRSKGKTGTKRKSDQAELDLDSDLGSEDGGGRGGAAAGDSMTLRKKRRSSRRGGRVGRGGRDGFGKGGFEA
jgi:hypothetical protein